MEHFEKFFLNLLLQWQELWILNSIRELVAVPEGHLLVFLSSRRYKIGSAQFSSVLRLSALSYPESSWPLWWSSAVSSSQHLPAHSQPPWHQPWVWWRRRGPYPCTSTRDDHQNSDWPPLPSTLWRGERVKKEVSSCLICSDNRLQVHQNDITVCLLLWGKFSIDLWYGTRRKEREHKEMLSDAITCFNCVCIRVWGY